MSKPKIQKENGLLLTLKELIKLGIINPIRNKKDKKERRKKEKKSSLSGFSRPTRLYRNKEKVSKATGGITSTVSSSPTILLPNSDVRQLSIANDANNTRFMELKNDVTSEKQKNDLFIENGKEAFKYIVSSMGSLQQQQLLDSQKKPTRFALNTGSYNNPMYEGFAEDDNIDVTRTVDDTAFEPQINIEPGGTSPFLTEERVEFSKSESKPLSEPDNQRSLRLEEGVKFIRPEESKSQSKLRFTDYFKSRNINFPPARRPPPARPQQEPKPKQDPSFTPQEATTFNPLTVSSGAFDSREFTPIKGISESFQPSSYKSVSGEPLDKKEKSLFQQVQEGSVKYEKIYSKPLESQEFSEFSQEPPQKQGGGTRIPEYKERFQDTKTKPTKGLIRDIKQFYIDEYGADEEVLQSNKKNVIVNGLNKLLQSKYIKAGGTDDKILNSKNPDVIKNATILLNFA